jgi:Cdc6-like AAA superfamily ATPase
MSKATIYIVGGGKGGVGKTMTSMTLLDWLLNDKKNKAVTLIETDDSNPDVYKSYEKTEAVEKHVINLDTESGWITLMNQMPNWAKENKQVVINTAARATPVLSKNINDLHKGADQLNITIHFLWPINRQRDSLLLLNSVLKYAPTITTRTTVIKNLYWGNIEKFVLYDASEVVKKVKTIELPDLNDFVSDRIYIERLPLHDTEPFQFGERIALNRYRNNSYDQFNKLA